MYGAEPGLAVGGTGGLVEDLVAAAALMLTFSRAGTKPVAVHTGAPRGAAPAPGKHSSGTFVHSPQRLTSVLEYTRIPDGSRVNVDQSSCRISRATLILTCAV